MRNNRNQSFQNEQVGKVRWCLTLIGIAMMVWPWFATNDTHPISFPLMVQAISVCLAGVLLIKTQVEAVFCKSR
jgi:hypothetical protein